MKGILGTKLGMTRIFDEDGLSVPVTVVEAGPCTILQTRTQEKNGYSAVQLGFGSRKVKNVTKPVLGGLPESCKDTPPAWIKEIRLEADSDKEIGSELTVEIFGENEYVDISGTTKGRGFQGVVRRYRFGGGRASHGGDWLRKPGSIGMCESPAKVYKGRKMPGQMGNAQRTVQNLKVVRVITDENLLLIKGAVPGPNGGRVVVKSAKKK
jgi:large subunit ribosomal protein L3